MHSSLILVEALLVLLVLLAGFAAYLAYRCFKNARWTRAVLWGLLFVVIIPPVAVSLPSQEGFSRIFQRGPQRTADCMTGKNLIAEPMADKHGSEKGAEGGCSVSFVENPGFNTSKAIPARDCWLNPQWQGHCYSIAAIEFSESGGLLDDNQPKRLSAHLTALRGALPNIPGDPPEIYVIAFVHGWRHDARTGDGDFARLRVITSNASMNLAERCRITGHHCAAAVVGVFMGWPGRLSLWDTNGCVTNPDEPPQLPDVPCRSETLAEILNAATFPTRKVVSDHVGSAILGQVQFIRKTVDALFPIAPRAVHSVLIGHSLGGNAILTALDANKPAVDGSNWPADLTVLMNPATETSKWIDLTNHFDHPWPDNTPPCIMFIATPESFYSSAILDTCKSLPTDDKRCKYLKASNEAAIAYHDPAVGTFFKWSQFLASPFAGKNNLFGLGHRPISGEWDAARVYTHYVEVNASPAYQMPGTGYQAVAGPRNVCFVEPGFITAARKRTAAGKGWDFRPPSEVGTLGRTVNYDTRPFEPLRSMGKAESEDVDHACNARKAIRSKAQVNVQFGSFFFPTSRSLPERISPLWGVRADSSAVHQHGGYMSAPILCMFNKIVFDDPTGTGDPDKFRGKYTVPQRLFVEELKPTCRDQAVLTETGKSSAVPADAQSSRTLAQ